MGEVYRRSALGARRSALGARRSALGARRSALGARKSLTSTRWIARNWGDGDEAPWGAATPVRRFGCRRATASRIAARAQLYFTRLSGADSSVEAARSA